MLVCGHFLSIHSFVIFHHFSDTPDVDIVGANLYNRYIQTDLIKTNNLQLSEEDKKKHMGDIISSDIPACRNTPLGADFLPQTVEESFGVLVCTGCYKPDAVAGGRGGKESDGDNKTYHGHRDFAYNSSLCRPVATVDDVEKAIEFILKRENFVA